MKVIGTAGHVDHGKSALVKALTGIDPDRLREEKEREMTIDLGFAWLTTPSGQTASIVDVPGHEDFIKNMLAGVGGIDIALLVVAADEGIMPQTREHLAILDLLGIREGVVALTKTDLVDEPEWLELVREEIAEELADTSLAGAAIIPVSAVTGAGLPELIAEIDKLLSRAGSKRDLGRPRLSIDRAFTIAGFGTIVTGTLIDGSLEVGQEVEILPGGRRSRIRGLQTHKRRIERATPGSRVAVNLVGLGVNELHRGDVLTTPGWLHPTILLDAELRLLPSVTKALKHGRVVDFFTGAAQVQARVRLLDRDELKPGDTAWVQLRLLKPVATIRGDRFIIRQPSPSTTLGGGRVVSHHPGRQYRRFRSQVIRHMEILANGTPREIIAHLLQQCGVATVEQITELSGLPSSTITATLEEMMGEGEIMPISPAEGSNAQLTPQTILSSTIGWARVIERITDLLRDYHRRYPLRAGMAREELKNKLRLSSRIFNAIISRAAAEGLIRQSDATLALSEHRVTFTPKQKERIEELLNRFARQPYTPPSVSEAESIVGTQVLAAMVEKGDLVKVSENVLFTPKVYEEMRKKIIAHLKAKGSITVAQVRDMFNTSRKYALALLEHLDERRITRRIGDERILR